MHLQPGYGEQVPEAHQRERFVGTRLLCNADKQPADVRVHCQVDATGKSLLKAAMTQSSVPLWTLTQLQLSARAYHRILKQPRTIPDLSGSEEIQPLHLAEAIQYRPRRLF